MLDLQRQRYSPRHHADISFTRVLIATHLFLGLLAAVLLMFHELFSTSLMVAFWYLISLGLIFGVLTHRQWCRILLGLTFFGGSALGLFYLMWLAPSLAPEHSPVLSLKLLPFWLSTFAFAYAAGGMVILISSRIQRATTYGFTLWDKATY